MIGIDDGRGMPVEVYDRHPNERRRFTFHLDFLAFPESQALLFAEVYAEGLSAFRLETDRSTARVTIDGNHAHTRPVYCGAPGPHPGDICEDVTGHELDHHSDTSQWTDQDVPPTPPDAPTRRLGPAEFCEKTGRV